MAGAQGIRAGKAFVELGADPSPLNRALRTAVSMMRGWGQSIQSIGAQMAAAGVAITAPLDRLGGQLAERAREMLRLAESTGTSVEEIQGLGFAALRTGADSEDLERGLLRMNRLIEQAAAGSRSANHLLDRLGVSLDQLSPLSTAQRLGVFTDAINQFGDAGQRAGIRAEILGQRARHLGALLSQGSGGINRLMQEAERRGLVISEAELQGARQFGRDLTVIADALKTATLIIANGLVPGLQQAYIGDRNIAQAIIAIARATSNWLRQNAGLIKTIFNIGLYLTYAGSAVLVIGRILPAIAHSLYVTRVLAVGWNAAMIAIRYTVIGIRAAIMALYAPTLLFNAIMALTNPLILGGLAAVLLLGAAIAGVIYLLGGWGPTMEAVGQTGSEALGIWGPAMREIAQTGREVANDLIESWDGVRDAIMAGDLTLALRVAGALMMVEWTRLTGWFGDTWAAFVHLFFSTCLNIAEAMADVASQIVGGFRIAFSWLQTGLGHLIGWFLDAGTQIVGGWRIAWARLTNLTEAGFAAERDRIVAETEAERERLRTVTAQNTGTPTPQIVQETEAHRAQIRERAAAIRAHYDRVLIAEQHGNAQELADAQDALAEAIAAAARARREHDNQHRPPPEAGPGIEQEIVGRSSRGTFNGAVASQILGGGGGGTAADRAEAIAQNQLRALETMRDYMQDLIRQARAAGGLFFGG